MEIKDSINARSVPAFLVIKIDSLKRLFLNVLIVPNHLKKVKEKQDFIVFKCKNNEYPYYQKKLNGMSSKEKKRFKKYPQPFKMRYIYREFRIDFQPLLK